MCGIVGIYNHENAADLAALAMFAEQHRGQESCGIAVSDEITFKLRKKMGLVKEVFTANELMQLKGSIAVGHVRYPTRGASSEYNSQPHVVETLAGPSFALASNGDIVNYQEIREKLESKGVYFSSYNDGELILKYIIYKVEKEDFNIVDAIRSLMKNIKGAFSTVLANKNELYILSDPYGIRPIIYGKLYDDTVVVASESCALDILAPEWKKEVLPSEIIVVNERGIRSIKDDPNKYRKYDSNKHCIFEQIYFSRPDSYEFGENVYEVRERIGAKLAESDDIDVDYVVPVPDSANFIAMGYATKKDAKFEMGLIRNHYVGRTFIKPEQTIRDESVKQKFNPLPNFFDNKKIALVDDSIVRGTTIKKLVRLLKNSGAAEVHIRIGSPPVKYSCYYGIDTPTNKELIVNNRSIEEIREFVGADSIKYLKMEQLRDCVAEPEKFCYSCFDGKYPVE